MLSAMKVLQVIARRQLSPAHALRLCVGRALSTRASLWIWLGYGLGYGLIISFFNVRHNPNAWTSNVPYAFLSSLAFAGLITLFNSLPWRMRLLPRRMATMGSVLLCNGLLSVVMGVVFFFLSLSVAGVVVYGTGNLGDYLGRYAQASVWGLVYAPVALPIAMGEVMDRRGRHSRAREKKFALMAEQARAVALRAQINPHFFFNALNTIAALIPAQPSEAERAVELLAQALRPVLTREQPLLGTVQTEFEIASAYGEIEKLRHGRRLSIIFSSDPAADAVLVPSLSIQPLVENAVTHGAARCTEAYCVRVLAERTDGKLRVSVTGEPDDAPWGTGTPQAMEKVRGHALENIELRAQALFGTAARLDVLSAVGPSSCATLAIPLSGPVSALASHGPTRAVIETAMERPPA